MTLDPQIRRFRWSDLEKFTHLYNRVNGIANSERSWDLEFMGQFLSQPSCRPEEDCYVAEFDDSLLGFVLVAPELPIGRAVASGGVLASFRGRGVGRGLLRTAIERATCLRASRLHVQAAADEERAERLLSSEEFMKVRRYWRMKWDGDDVPAVELPEGIRLRTFRPGQDEQALTELQNAAFGQHWGFCPNTVEQIGARARLKRCDPQGIVLAAEGDRMCAYNWTMRESNEFGSIGWISMTGVHPHYRGKRMGAAVVVNGMKYLVDRGANCIELEVDAENATARKLYLSLGFLKVEETLWYEKRLAD